MKYLIGLLLVLNAASTTGICQKIRGSDNKGSTGTQGVSTAKCPRNLDPLYSRQQVLEKLAGILNISVFGSKEKRLEFSVVNERPSRFFVFDLTDPSNKGFPLGDCIMLTNNHIYHFAPMRKRYSFSHIAVLEDGILKVFRSINCKGKGESLEDALSYVKSRLKDHRDNTQILNRLKDYRKYGIYYSVDASILECDSP